MIRAQATWAQVETGSYILDANEHMWKVDTIDVFTSKINLVDKDGRRAAIDPPDPARPVMMIVPTMDEAVATFYRVIGVTGIREEQLTSSQ